MADPELDYQLMKVCKHMIKVGALCSSSQSCTGFLFNTNAVALQRFCPESDGKNFLQCLKQNKNSELMDPKCKMMITRRQMTQNSGTVSS